MWLLQCSRANSLLFNLLSASLTHCCHHQMITKAAFLYLCISNFLSPHPISFFLLCGPAGQGGACWSTESAELQAPGGDGRPPGRGGHRESSRAWLRPVSSPCVVHPSALISQSPSCHRQPAFVSSEFFVHHFGDLVLTYIRALPFKCKNIPKCISHWRTAHYCNGVLPWTHVILSDPIFKSRLEMCFLIHTLKS